MAKTLPRIKKVDIVVIEDGKEKTEQVTVQKQGIGKWKQLSDALDGLQKKLPQMMEDMGYKDVDDLLSNITVDVLLGLVPKLWSTIIDEITGILVLGTDADEEFILNHVGLDEVMVLLADIIEVNQLMRAVELGKNLPFLRSLIMPAPQKIAPLTTKKPMTVSSGDSKKQQA